MSMTCISKTLFTRRSEEVVIALNLYDMGNGHFSTEKRTINLKTKMNFEDFYKGFMTKSQAEAHLGNEFIHLREHGWVNIQSEDYQGKLKVIHVGYCTFILNGKETPTVVCTAQRPDFDKDVEYLLHDITDDGYLLVENSFGEVVHCQPEGFIHSLSEA